MATIEHIHISDLALNRFNEYRINISPHRNGELTLSVLVYMNIIGIYVYTIAIIITTISMGILLDSLSTINIEEILLLIPMSVSALIAVFYGASILLKLEITKAATDLPEKITTPAGLHVVSAE